MAFRTQGYRIIDSVRSIICQRHYMMHFEETVAVFGSEIQVPVAKGDVLRQILSSIVINLFISGLVT